jgi:uncharacterized protein YbjT (DUF2867 family)
MYVVLGASGHTGSVVAQTLLKKGEKVRAVGRSKDRLAPLASQGAEAFVADAADAQALTKAFQGARAVYALLPPNLNTDDFVGYQGRVSDAIAKAVETARVTHVLALSSIGADKESGTGPVVALHRMETQLNRIQGLSVLHLRAGYFMENTVPQANIIRNLGKVAGPIRPDLPLPMIATRDIGAFAADALSKLQFSGKQTRELHGQRDISYTEVARIIGSAIGKPDLTYVQLPPEQVIQGMTQMGMSRNMAELLCEMSDALNRGYMKALELRTPANTTPTAFEAFVREVWLPVHQGRAATA